MENLNVINLIQAGTTTVSILGGVLLWQNKVKEYRGIAICLFLTAFAACINIFEESGLTRDIYLISPIFIMLFGPATYLAAKLIIDKTLTKSQLWHLLPVIPLLMFTSYTYAIIGIGTLWRLAYAVLTAIMLLKYKRTLDAERSDSDDYSLHWLIWVLAVTAVFNLVDLVRLNLQHVIQSDLNLLGQGINNSVWLIATMVIIIKLQNQENVPKTQGAENTASKRVSNANKVSITTHSTASEYRSIFAELDNLITANTWFLKPRLTLGDVSELTGLQTREISRAINLVTEKSFNDYINHFRVNFVCNALDKDEQNSLTNIAAEAGFSSKASFNKVFKQVVGVTPTEYKAR